MAFTKIVSPGIDTTGSYTVQELNTVGVVTAATVQVGSATTVHTTGIDLGSGNITSHNINSTGIITATSFVGPVTGTDITATSGTFSGNVSIGGTLTYEDVTNIDSVGIITARSGINATGDITFGTNSKAKLFENGTQSGVQATNSGSSAHLMTHDGNEDIHVDPSGYIKFEVAGLERLRIDSSGRVLLSGATSSNTERLYVKGSSSTTSGIFIHNANGATNSSADLWFGHWTNSSTPSAYAARISALNKNVNTGVTDLLFHVYDGNNALERLRIDSSGRILVGTDTAPTAAVTSSALFVVEGYTGVPTGDALISLQRGQAPASISSGAQLGGINFGANDGSRYAQIHVNSDGVGGTNDYPGRLVFSTTSDGSATPTERLRITSAGNITIGTASNPGGKLFFESSSGSAQCIRSGGTNNQNLLFGTVSTEYLRLTSDGNMGLGASNPGADPAVGNAAKVFEIRQTTSGNISSGSNRRGAVLRLKHEAQWENGYQNSANDDLGRVEFVTGDASTGEGIRSIIRCRNLQYYNDQALTFEVAEANSSTIVERLRISSDGDIGISDSAPTRKLSINGSMNLASGSRIESYSSGGNLIIQGGSTYPGGHIKMWGGSGDDMITFNTSGGSTSSIERARITSDGLTFNGDTAAANALDDYEEGTYTPKMYAGTGTTEPAYNWRYGQYVKIGEKVTVWGALGINGSFPSASSIYVGNLPYSQVWNSSNFFYYVQLHGYTWASGYSDSGADTKLFLQPANTVSTRFLVVNGASKANTTNSMIGSGQRFTFCVSYVAG